MMISSRTSFTAFLSCLSPRTSLTLDNDPARTGVPGPVAGPGFDLRGNGRKISVMTTTISIDALRDLAGFRAEHGCAVSLFLDLDPSISPTAGDVAVRVSSLLSE